MKTRPHPPARPHGAIEELLPNIFFVTGTVAMPGPLPMRFSRAMTIVREDGRLILINSVRLDDAGLRALDALGRVTDVVRLAGNHGADDPFYKERYGARVWAVRDAPYMPGFDPKAEPYFEPDVRFDANSTLPISGARAYVIAARPPEAVLILARDGGVAIAGDALQNWAASDPYFNWAGSLVMKAMGFLKPHNVGPGWLAQCKPPAGELRGLLDLTFEHVLPAHGSPVLGGARGKFQPAIERAAAKRA